jgi:hypothetical protein
VLGPVSKNTELALEADSELAAYSRER